MPIWKDTVLNRKKAFITGVAGFAGSYLAELLLRQGVNVYGLLAPKEQTGNIDDIKSGLVLERFDLLNSSKTAKFISMVKPDYIFHLAAMASVGKTFNSVQNVFDVNFGGSLNVFDAASNVKNLKKLIFISSSDIYGIIKPTDKALDEKRPLNPVSPYGISKATGEYLANYYFYSKKLPVVRSRSFNHTGPKQTDDFVVPSLCRQIIKAGKGRKSSVIKVGNLSACRDFSDVRDIVTGYYLMAIKGKPGDVYQLCSGTSISIKQVLQKLIKISGQNIKVVVDKKKLRKVDIPVIKGNNRKAIKELGWKRKYTLEDTLRQTLNYWRAKSQN